MRSRHRLLKRFCHSLLQSHPAPLCQRRLEGSIAEICGDLRPNAVKFLPVSGHVESAYALQKRLGCTEQTCRALRLTERRQRPRDDWQTPRHFPPVLHLPRNLQCLPRGSQSARVVTLVLSQEGKIEVEDRHTARFACLKTDVETLFIR